MMIDPARAALGCSWAEAQAAAHEHREAAEATVVRWAWGPNLAGWERLEPLFVQRAHGERPRTRELPEPEDRTTRDQFGFDADGRVVVARRFQNWPIAGIREETVLVEGVAGPVQLTLRHWGDQLELTRLGVPRFDDGRITEMAWHHQDPRDGFGGYRERYRYDGNRLAGVDYDSSDPDRAASRQQVIWDSDGELGRIVATVEDRRFTKYVRSPKGGIAPVRERVAGELVERIVAWVARCAPAEPVWALALLYDAESGGAKLPPSLGLAVDDDRNEQEAIMFNPAEWELMDVEPSEFADEAFAEDCLVLNQTWDAAGSFTSGRRLLLEVARELRDRDWSKALSLAEDFEILAVDLELEDLARNRRALTR